VFREESGQVVASLVRLFGDIDIAEEAVQDAFVIAASKWPLAGLPPNPGGWIATTARNRALDKLRRESHRHDKYAQAAVLRYDTATEADGAGAAGGAVNDDRLRLIFTCCHPALAPEAQVALTLRLLGGLHAGEIARAFVVPETTMRQRLTRAKAKIKANNIPYRVPDDAELPDRLKPVLTVVYLIFNEGYTASTGDDLVRDDLCAEAIRLARLLVELMPDEPEALGLLGLLVLVEARRPARTAGDGSLVLLADQDRGSWNRALIDEGQALVRQCLRRQRPGPFQIQAAINAVHSDAATAADTDWRQIVVLYEQLMAIAPSPIVELNRAIAVAETTPDGPRVALALLDDADLARRLDDYQPFHATCADFLRRVGRHGEARRAYDRAIELSSNLTERRFLEHRRAALPG
jgi:RNA polymerase sigma-70 factor (ECF subfamily)